MNPRRTIRRVLPLAAAVAVSISAAATPSGAQPTADDDCYLYAFGFVNPFLVAELTIMGRPGESVQVGQRALLHDVSDRWTFEDGVVKDAAGAIIAPYRGSVSAVNGSRIEVKMTVARESASGGSPDRVSRGPGQGLAAVFEIEGCNARDGRAAAGRDGGTSERPTAASATVEAADGVPDAPAREPLAPFSFVSANMPLPNVGPDWSLVQEYIDAQGAWSGRPPELEAGLSAEERRRRLQEAWDERPDIRRAIAAATAIVDAGGTHDRTRGAADFLVAQTFREPDAARHMVRGARALVAHVPDYERWPRVLARMDGRRSYGFSGESSAPDLDRFFEELASGAAEPVVGAMARYYVAAGLMQSINAARLEAAERDAKRQRAIEAATGLSVGVESQRFGDTRSGSVGTSRTFAEVEADLLRTIRHATVGGTVLEITGRRLGGTEDRLSAYLGRVVLLNFWATWCVPCIDVLPELRELVAELPADRFALLGISVDEELETVTAFREREPMPWTNWHVGIDSDLARAWDVRGFPTYVLVDDQGVILARGNGIDGPFFRSLLDEAVEDIAR